MSKMKDLLATIQQEIESLDSEIQSMRRYDYLWSISRRDRYKRIFSEGLSMANKGNPFWTQSDAMSAFASFHREV